MSSFGTTKLNLCQLSLSRSVVSDTLWPHGQQHARLPCPSPTPRACSNFCPSSQWCYPTISSSVVPISSHLQSFTASLFTIAKTWKQPKCPLTGGERRCDIYIQWNIQFSSAAQLCLTLCDPMDCSTPGFPVHHQLLELAQTHVHRVSDAIQPSHPLSSPSPHYDSFNRNYLIIDLISNRVTLEG